MNNFILDMRKTNSYKFDHLLIKKSNTDLIIINSKIIFTQTIQNIFLPMFFGFQWVWC